MPGYMHGACYAAANGRREKRVLVPAGSVLFYDHNILHRATYSTTPQRGLYLNDRQRC
jgi:ectoine hydroxylase-related dioxygenase (phytanoyl-CoA dioxygenase family)